MKKVIKGKRYDTETAQIMGTYDKGLPTDLGYICETLYRKTTGEFFLHGEGGAYTKYAKATGQNSWRGGELIIPLSVEAAKEWAEEHLDGDEYEKIFGEIEETGEKKMISLTLPVGTIEAIKRGAAEEQMSLSDYVASVIPMR